MSISYGSQEGIHEIVLSFDDGPNPKTTPKILDALAENRIKAVFFVVGKNLEIRANRAIMKRAFNEGHIIGNHTYSHRALTKLSGEEIKEELKKTQDLIGECTSEPKLLRPPYGATSAVVNKIIHEEGYISVLWNVDTLDWQKRSPAWVEHAMEQIKHREDNLVLMHDIHESTAQSLTALIQNIKEIPGKYEFIKYV